MLNVDNEVYKLQKRIERLEKQIEFLLNHLDLRYLEETDVVNPRILELVRRGNKIEAIKIYREETGVSLKAAKDYIDSLSPD